MSRESNNLTLYQWLGILFVVCSCGVSVTVYALSNFEQKSDAQIREERLTKRLDELRENQKIFMEYSGTHYHESFKP